MNLSPSWASSFEASGFSALHWSSVGRADALDSEVFMFARQHGYVLLTHDLDFGAATVMPPDDAPNVTHNTPAGESAMHTIGVPLVFIGVH